MTIKRPGIEWGEGNIRGNHDIGQLTGCQCAAGFAEQAIADRVVIFEQDFADGMFSVHEIAIQDTMHSMDPHPH